LANAGQGELAAPHTVGEALRKAGDRLLPIDGDQLPKGREKGRIGYAVAVDSVENGLLPRLEQVVESHAPVVLDGKVTLQHVRSIIHEKIRAAVGAAAPTIATAFDVA
jgi:hypothetical protein